MSFNAQASAHVQLRRRYEGVVGYIGKGIITVVRGAEEEMGGRVRMGQ